MDTDVADFERIFVSIPALVLLLWCQHVSSRFEVGREKNTPRRRIYNFRVFLLLISSCRCPDCTPKKHKQREEERIKLKRDHPPPPLPRSLTRNKIKKNSVCQKKKTREREKEIGYITSTSPEITNHSDVELPQSFTIVSSGKKTRLIKSEVIFDVKSLLNEK